MGKRSMMPATDLGQKNTCMSHGALSAHRNRERPTPARAIGHPAPPSSLSDATIPSRRGSSGGRSALKPPRQRRSLRRGEHF